MRNVCIDHYDHLASSHIDIVVYINLSVRLYIIVVVVIYCILSIYLIQFLLVYTLYNSCWFLRWFAFNPIPLLSFQSPHSRSPSQQEQTQQLASPTPSPALLLPREDSLGHPLYSGGGRVALIPLLLVETSLWTVHHPTPSPSTHYASLMMDSTPARPLLGILPDRHQLHLQLKVIDWYSKAEHSVLVNHTILLMKN